MCDDSRTVYGLKSERHFPQMAGEMAHRQAFAILAEYRITIVVPMTVDAEGVCPEPRVSVLMPVFNGLPYIVEAVASVTEQDFDDWELVVSDNGSSDGTREYLATLSDHRIRVFLQDENLGVFGNLNFLLGEARATIAKILCADDTLLPHCLSEVIDVTDKSPMAMIRCYALGDAKEFGASGPSRLQGRLPDNLNPTESLLAFATFGNLMGNLSCAICRPLALLAHGSFDQRLPYAGDYEGWARYSRVHGFSICRKELVKIRLHEMQASRQFTKRNELVAELSEVLCRLVPFLAEDQKRITVEHWTRSRYPMHWPNTIRVMLAGHVRAAWAPWLCLPFGIRWWHTFLYYFPWRIRSCDDTPRARALVGSIDMLAPSQSPLASRGECSSLQRPMHRGE